MNNIINKLPFELHLPGYSYCGPGTKLAARLARGDPPINKLDSACREHDIAYSKNRDNIDYRNAADKILADKAWQRVLSKDSTLGEKAAAYAVTNAMNLKSKLGMGVKKKPKKVTLKSVIKNASKTIVPGKSAESLINSALEAAQDSIKKAGGKNNIEIPRILPVPTKIGGFLPLIPLFPVSVLQVP